MLNILLIVPGVERAVQIIEVDLCVVLVLRVYDAARESHNERSRNTLKHSTCSHKWCETLKCSVFGVKGALRRRVVAPAIRKRHSWALSFVSSEQCREQFVAPLSCFPQLMCNSLALRTHDLSASASRS